MSDAIDEAKAIITGVDLDAGGDTGMICTVRIDPDGSREVASTRKSPRVRVDATREPTDLFFMETPCCGVWVFVRDVDEFEDGERERCPDCGDLMMVSCDAETDATIIAADDPPDNWPHPWGVRACEGAE